MKKNIFDYCIAGSGPAAAFAANRLAKSGKKVVIIEAGGKPVDMDYNKFIDVKNSIIFGRSDFGFSKQIGGASNLWAGWLAKYDAVDFFKRERYNFEGWEMDFEELQHYYQEVNKVLKIDTNQEAENYNIGDIELRKMQILYNPFNTKDILQHKNIKIISFTTLNKLILNEEKNAVKSVLAYDQNQKKIKEFHSRKFILGAGTISNVRVLLNSFSKADIPCFDSIGKYLSTHPKIFIGHFKPSKALSKKNPFIYNERLTTHWNRFQFGLSPDFLISNDLLNHCLRFDSNFIYRLIKIFERVKLFIGKIPFLHSRNQIISNTLVDIGVYIFRILETTNLPILNNKTISVRGFFDQASRYENRIELSKELSNDGLPLAKVFWDFNKEDWNNVNNFMKCFANQVKKEKLGDFHFQIPEKDKISGLHSHFIGGTRMGKHVSSSVVDGNLKFHDLKNLFISGPSVFPSYGYANPFYTISALSIRLAEYLIQSDD